MIVVEGKDRKEELRRKISDIRRRNLKEKPLTKPTFWTKRDRMFHGMGVVHYAVLDTGGCRWATESGGCSMCGYVYDSCCRQVSLEEIATQMDQIQERLQPSKEPFGLRIFTSGSFFDKREIGSETREHILMKLGKIDGLIELTVETRPEHVERDALSSMLDVLPGVEIEVAIGLESSNDWVRDFCIGKGFSFRDFERASKLIRAAGARCKAYLLLKPPFLTEFDSGYDVIESVRDVRNLTDSLSINACNVQRGTLVEELFNAGRYRPPWIWTIAEVLRHARELVGEDKSIICDTVAFGTMRGPRNCRRCNKKATAMVRSFSLTQDNSHLGDLSCACKGGWERIYYYNF